METPSPESHLNEESDLPSPSASDPSVSTDESLAPTQAEESHSSLEWTDDWGEEFDAGPDAGPVTGVTSDSGDSDDWGNDWREEAKAEEAEEAEESGVSVPTPVDSSCEQETRDIDRQDQESDLVSSDPDSEAVIPSSPSSPQCEPNTATATADTDIDVISENDFDPDFSDRGDEEEEEAGECESDVCVGVEAEAEAEAEAEEVNFSGSASSSGLDGVGVDGGESDSDDVEEASESESESEISELELELAKSESESDSESQLEPQLEPQPEPQPRPESEEIETTRSDIATTAATADVDDDDWDDDWGDDTCGGMDDDDFGTDVTTTPAEVEAEPEVEAMPSTNPNPVESGQPKVKTPPQKTTTKKLKTPHVDPISLVSQIFGVGVGVGDKSGVTPKPFPRDAVHEIIQSMVYPPSEYDIWTEKDADDADLEVEDSSPFDAEFPVISLVDLYFGESENPREAVGIADRPVQVQKRKKRRLKDFSWSDSLMELRFLKAIGFVKSRDAGRFGQLQTPAATAAFVSSAAANSPANFSRPRRSSSEPSPLPQAAEKLVSSSEADSSEAISPPSGPTSSSVPGEILEQSEKFIESRVDASEWGEMEKELDRVQDTKKASSASPEESSIVTPDPIEQSHPQIDADAAEDVVPPEAVPPDPKPPQPPPPPDVSVSPPTRGVVTFSAPPKSKSRKGKPKLSLRLRTSPLRSPPSLKTTSLREEINQFAKDETEVEVEDEWNGVDGFDDVSQGFGSFDDEDDAFPDDDEFALDSTGILPQAEPPPSPPEPVAETAPMSILSPIVIPPSPKHVEGVSIPTEIEIEPDTQVSDEPESTSDVLGGFDLSAFVPDSVSPAPAEKVETSFLDDFLGGRVDDDEEDDVDDQVRAILDLIPDLSGLK